MSTTLEAQNSILVLKKLMEKYSLLTPNQKSYSVDWLHFPQMMTKLLATESYLLYFGLQHLSDCLKLCSKTCTQSTVPTTQNQMLAHLNVSTLLHLLVQSVAFLTQDFPLFEMGDVVANQIMWLRVQETQTTKTQARGWPCRIHWPYRIPV